MLKIQIAKSLRILDAPVGLSPSHVGTHHRMLMDRMAHNCFCHKGEMCYKRGRRLLPDGFLQHAARA